MAHEFDDSRWQAESDARALAEAKEINGDTARLGKAQEAAVRLAEEKKKEANAMSSVAISKTAAAFPNQPEMLR